MRSRFKKYKLSTLISEISNRNNRNQIDRVYSVTNSEGFIQSTDYFDKEVFSRDISNYKIVKHYQFAYNPSRINVGSIAYLQEQDDVVVSPLYVVFNCTDALVPEYLLKFIKSPIGLTNVKNKTRGSVRESLNYSSLSDIEIPLPTMAEQLKIASILNKAEELIGQRKYSIELLDELLKSTFFKMFGDPYFNPYNFKKDVLQNYFSKEPQNGLYKHSSEYGEGTRILRIDSFYDGRVEDVEGLKRVKMSLDEVTKFGLNKNDIVINRVNSREYLGKVGLIPMLVEPTVFESNMMRFSVEEEKLNPIYLVALLSTKFVKQQILKRAKDAVNQSSINQQDVNQFEILVPPLPLQNEFAAIVEKIEALKAQFQNSLSDLEELYASLCQQAFKGELDLSAVEIDETLLPDEQKVEPVITMPPGLQKAIELSDKINKQFEGINRVTKVPSALTKQLEQWNKLEDQFKHIPKLPEALLQAQKNIERIQEVIGISKAVTQKTSADEEHGFNWAVLANRIKERYKDRHFNFEMLHNFIQKDRLAEATPYYASEELKTNPRLNEADDLKSFIQTAIQNIEMDEKQQRQINPFLRLTQSFYNAEEENFTLSLHKEDFKLIKDKTARQRSGIYFSLATEA